MREMIVKGIRIDDTFAEAFNMRATAVIITADSARWARQAAVTMTGFGTSVIGCGCEAGIDGELSPRETPDRRPGIRVLLFAVSTSELQRQLQNRVGQCVLTTPGSACYAGLEGEEALKLGNALRFFGDGWQISKRFAGKHYWRVPVMDGEFVCEAATGLTKGAVGGGNLLIMGREPRTTLAAAEAAVGGDRRGSGRDHAISRRDRPVGIKGGIEVQGQRLHQRSLLPDTKGGGERARSGPRSGRCWRSSSTD